jgi:hypothetical protein
MPTLRQSLLVVPPFSLKGLFIGIALIAAGGASFKAMYDYSPWSGPVFPTLLFFGGGALVGAGIGLPFNKAGKCALLAFGLQALFVAIFWWLGTM